MSETERTMDRLLREAFARPKPEPKEGDNVR